MDWLAWVLEMWASLTWTFKEKKMTKMSHSRLRPLSPTVFLSSAKLASTFLRCSIEKCGSFLSHNLSVENCGQKRPKSEAKTTAILKVDAPAWGVMAHVPKTGKFMQAFPKAGICCAFADYTFGARAVCRPINGRGCAEISDGVQCPDDVKTPGRPNLPPPNASISETLDAARLVAEQSHGAHVVSQQQPFYSSAYFFSTL
ncbi:hypothetical protein ABIA20_006586 [Sinorhizobium fredii]